MPLSALRYLGSALFWPCKRVEKLASADDVPSALAGPRTQGHSPRPGRGSAAGSTAENCRRWCCKRPLVGLPRRPSLPPRGNRFRRSGRSRRTSGGAPSASPRGPSPRAGAADAAGRCPGGESRLGSASRRLWPSKRARRASPLRRRPLDEPCARPAKHFAGSRKLPRLRRQLRASRRFRRKPPIGRPDGPCAQLGRDKPPRLAAALPFRRRAGRGSAESPVRDVAWTALEGTRRHGPAAGRACGWDRTGRGRPVIARQASPQRCCESPPCARPAAEGPAGPRRRA